MPPGSIVRREQHGGGEESQGGGTTVYSDVRLGDSPSLLMSRSDSKPAKAGDLALEDGEQRWDQRA